MISLKRTAILALVLAVAMGSGCASFDYNETEDLQFITGMAVDRTSDGRMKLTLELESAKSGTEMDIKSMYLEAEGDNLNDAARNILKYTDKALFWGHMNLVLVSQQVARDDMAEVTDMAMRMPAIRLGLVIAVSKMPTANEVLTMEREPGTTPMNTDLITNSIENQKRLGKVANTKLYQYLDDTVDEGGSPVLAAVSVISAPKGKRLEVAGAAIFNQSWFAGFLDETETRTMMIASNEKITTVLPLPEDPQGHYRAASVEVFPNKVTIRPVFIDGRAEAGIEIDADIVLTNLGGASNDKKQFKAITEAVTRNAAMALESQVAALMEKTKGMEADVLGIGVLLQDKEPKTWKEINHRWRELYRELKVTVSARLKMRNTGLIQEPLKKED